MTAVAAAQPSEILWHPPADARAKSRIGAYMDWREKAMGRRFADYDSLWRWSVDDLNGFWSSIWEYFRIAASRPPTQALAGGMMPGAIWFPGARLNYAEHALRGEFSGPAVIALSQTRPERLLTIPELRDAVARCREGLRRLGVGAGDRVVAYMPNIPETLAAFLATASLGAIWSSCAPEFGPKSVIDRFRQIEPKVFLTIDGYRYGDQDIDRMAQVGAIRAALPTLKAAVLLPYLADAPPATWDGLSWGDIVAHDGPLAFEQVAFDHPLYILYSSGTTGLPKAIVHGHGGILLEHLKTISFHLDIGAGDRFFWFSTTGWMMWNLLSSALLVRATIVMFDGDPAWPDQGTLWKLADRAGVTYFGVSASFLAACMNARLDLRRIANLSKMRGLGSTGSPLPPAVAKWVYREVPPTVLIGSGSGGTDICSAFVGAVPLKPVRADEISCRFLGAKVAAFDENRRSVVNQMGELVVTAPMPSMPVFFWGDKDGSRYLSAYFDRYRGVWRHGDWITIKPWGACEIHGRSDATLNRGGVRLGTAEYYALVENLPTVSGSLVVHLDDKAGGAGKLLLFVVPKPDVEWSPAVADDVKRQIRTELSPRHVPDEVHRISAVPRTLTGKKLEVPIKRILLGAPVAEVATEGAVTHSWVLAEFAALARKYRPAGGEAQ